MNYRNVATNELVESVNIFTNYSVGQVILSIVKQRKDKSISISDWLFNVTDEDFFTALEKARIAEKPEAEVFNND